MKKTTKVFTYWIDIVGTCNLRCPSCPTGNFTAADYAGEANVTGFMDFGLYGEILGKIKRDGPSLNPQIHLYNWGEPLMHPEAPRFVEAARKEGLYIGVSSNLNLEKNLKETVKAHPDYFRISLSGYYQDTYGRTHRRGNVLMVKSNMYRLRRYMEMYRKDFYCEVAYHVYRDNTGRDVAMMVDLCNELHFNFSPVWAYLMSAEKNLRVLGGEVEEADRPLLELLPIPPEAFLRECRPFKDRACDLLEKTTAINFDGSVQLCCNSYDRANLAAPSFLDISHEDLQAAKRAHPLCRSCTENALHVAAVYGAGPALDEVGNRALRAAGSPHEIHQFGEPKVVARETGAAVPILGRPESEMTGRKKVRGLRALGMRLRNAVAGHP